jgi:S-adenosyl methyltransferase
VPGSYLALSHMTSETHPQAALAIFQMTQDLRWNTPLISRGRANIARFFDGFTLVEPGLVSAADARIRCGCAFASSPASRSAETEIATNSNPISAPATPPLAAKKS